jgi:hypothetical protein
MLRFTLILGLLCFSLTILHAQDTLFPKDTILQRIDSNLISYYNGWYFYKGEQKVEMGFFAENLRKELNDFPDSKLYFEKYQKSRKVSALLSLTGGLMVIAGAISRPRTTEPALSNGLFIGGVVFMGTSIPFGFKANKQIRKSIFLYNKQKLLLPLGK